MQTSVQHLSWVLLRAVGVSPSQLMHLLGPMLGQLSSTDQQMGTLVSYIRRMGHVLENHPSSFGNDLGPRGGRGHFLATTEQGQNLTFAAMSGEAPASMARGKKLLAGLTFHESLV